MTGLQRWLMALATTAGAVLVAYEWLDRPLALFVHGRLAPHSPTVFEPLTHIPDPLIPLALIVFVAAGLWVLSGRRLSYLPATLVLCSFSVIMGQVLKNQLKFIFGRTWPETWVNNNPSFIHDGVFGFNWFHGGAGYASFPSGHMTATCAVIAVLWMRYPRLKPLYALAVLAVAAGLLGADFHFLSDVIAGSFVGASTGWMTVVLSDRLARTES